MGFKPEPTILNLTFQDTPFDGLEVKVKCCTIKEFDNMLRLATVQGGANTAEANNKTMETFLDKLVSWNLEDPVTGEPTPKTMEGIQSHEPKLMAAIITAWQIAQVSVEPPLKTNSSNGNISEEQSLGLGDVSQSPGSWPTQN